MTGAIDLMSLLALDPEALIQLAAIGSIPEPIPTSTLVDESDRALRDETSAFSIDEEG